MRVTAFKNVLFGVGVFISCGTLTSFAQELDLELDEVLETASSTQEANAWQHKCGDEIVPEGFVGPSQPDSTSTCMIFQNLYINKIVDGEQQRIGRLLSTKVLYATASGTNDRLLYLSMNLPLGVDLRPGAVIRVDESPETNLPYLQCTKAGCAVSRLIDNEFLEWMKRGNELLVGFRTWGVAETTVVNVSLMGFSRAFAALE